MLKEKVPTVARPEGSLPGKTVAERLAAKNAEMAARDTRVTAGAVVRIPKVEEIVEQCVKAELKKLTDKAKGKK